jgi:hypothetical protein
MNCQYAVWPNFAQFPYRGLGIFFKQMILEENGSSLIQRWFSVLTEVAISLSTEVAALLDFSNLTKRI